MLYLGKEDKLVNTGFRFKKRRGDGKVALIKLTPRSPFLEGAEKFRI